MTAPAVDYGALVGNDRIHVSLYTDPRVFADEMERIFHRGWVFVGHESEIPDPGDFVSRPLGEQPVIMARTTGGDVVVMLNRCAHRGTLVCPLDRGHTRVFACPYHGWTYDVDGTLLGVPYPSGLDAAFDKREHGLTRAPRQAAYRGFVFASLSPDGISLTEHLGAATGWHGARVVRDAGGLTRGLEREHVDAQGRTVSHVTDETINRALWRHYRAVMTEA